MSHQINGQDDHLVSSIGPKKHKFGERVLRSFFLSSFSDFNSSVLEKSKKCPSQSKDGSEILFFANGSKNTNLLGDVQFLLPVKFRHIPFSGLGEVENVSVNHRPGQPSSFFLSARKTKTCQRMLRSCFLSSFSELNSSVSEKSLKCPSQSEDGWTSCFSQWPEKYTLYMLGDVQFLLPVKFWQIT